MATGSSNEEYEIEWLPKFLENLVKFNHYHPIFYEISRICIDAEMVENPSLKLMYSCLT